jgi:hypothetical protein
MKKAPQKDALLQKGFSPVLYPIDRLSFTDFSTRNLSLVFFSAQYQRSFEPTETAKAPASNASEIS